MSEKNKFWRITLDTNPEDCNLMCIMCEEHSKYSDFKEKLFAETGVRYRRMPLEMIDKIITEATELGVQEIIPSTMGEPLLYKGIEKIFELAKDKGIKINLTTNGTFPGKKVEEWAAIIIPNTTDVKISWNGATADTFEKIMINANFNKMLENLKVLIEYRDLYQKETGYFCRITLQLTFMQNNMHELVDIVKLATRLGVDRIKGHHLWTHFKEIEGMSMKASKESIVQWNKYVESAHLVQQEYLKPNGEKVILENIERIVENEPKLVPESYECPFLGKEIWISATGKISPCCAPDTLRQSLGDFGNIASISISDMLNSEKYQDLVANYKDHKLCKTCNMRKMK